MITSIGNAAVWVSDLERSEAFYVDALGRDVIARVEASEVTELIVGRQGSGSHLMLAVSADGAPPPDGSTPTGFWKTFLWTDDLHGDLARAVAAGATVAHEPEVLDAHGITIAVVTDPDGYLVELGMTA